MTFWPTPLQFAGWQEPDWIHHSRNADQQRHAFFEALGCWRWINDSSTPRQHCQNVARVASAAALAFQNHKRRASAQATGRMQSRACIDIAGPAIQYSSSAPSTESHRGRAGSSPGAQGCSEPHDTSLLLPVLTRSTLRTARENASQNTSGRVAGLGIK